jgi:hypothetical protein
MSLAILPSSYLLSFPSTPSTLLYLVDLFSPSTITALHRHPFRIPALRFVSVCRVSVLFRASNSLLLLQSRHVIVLEAISYAENQLSVRFEFLTAVTMKNCVFWDVTPCG